MTRFRMFGIHLEQFAILTDKSQTDVLSMNTEVNFKYAEEGEKIACYAKFDFSEEQQRLMVLAINCEFEIHNEDFKELRKDGKTIIPKALLEFFAVHTIGTARGILFCKTESTQFNNVIIPPINVSELIQSDMVIE
jgi:hypothetical protein